MSGKRVHFKKVDYGQANCKTVMGISCNVIYLLFRYLPFDFLLDLLFLGMSGQNTYFKFLKARSVLLASITQESGLVLVGAIVIQINNLFFRT